VSATVIRDARVLTMLAPLEQRPPSAGRRGRMVGELGVVPRADVLVVEDRVASVARPESGGGGRFPESLRSIPIAREIDARGRVLMPGFVDCHTHACWAGSRMEEWERKLAGATYQQIMAGGGGIMSTVRATREASREDLGAGVLDRAGRMLRLGTTTIEVKSGYGLAAEHELKMLEAIVGAGRTFPGTIVPTALLGHALDPEMEAQAFVERTIAQTLPRVSRAFPGIAVDAFCERGAWDLSDCFRLLSAAREAGHPIRVHADQFTSLGMTAHAVSLGARSVDHLEASTPESLRELAESETFVVGLPVCGFHLDGRYANLRTLIEHGGKVCIATNFNPGSAPCPSMPLAIGLAVRHCGLTPAQAIGAATVNPACLLGLGDRGYIAPGARADLALLHHADERALAYEVGGNPVDTVLVGGSVVK
jgi:imidazolonepropionase